MLTDSIFEDSEYKSAVRRYSKIDIRVGYLDAYFSREKVR